MLKNTNLLDWCSSGNVSLPSATSASIISLGETVYLNISAKCSDNASIVPSGVKVLIEYETGSNNYTDVGLVQKGKIAIPGITLGKAYSLQIFYDGNSGKGTYTFNSTQVDILDYELPGDACKKLGLN